MPRLAPVISRSTTGTSEKIPFLDNIQRNLLEIDTVVFRTNDTKVYKK
jgi:hypothetical protein